MVTAAMRSGLRRNIIVSTAITDTFTRANNATSLGSTETGQPWTALSATWGITGNAAYIASGVAGNTLATVNAGRANFTAQLTNSIVTAQYPGMCFRVTDINNFWAWYRSASNAYTLSKIVAGTQTNVASATLTAANGDVLQVVTSGSSISCTVNGANLTSTTDTFNSTATGVGMFSYGAPSGSTFDNLSIA